MKILSKYWKGIVIALLVIILLAIIFRSCEKPVSHKDERDEVVALNKKAAKDKEVSDRYVDSVNKEINYRDSLLLVSKVKLDVAAIALDQSQDRATFLARQVKNAKGDTVKIIAVCDSLADVVLTMQGVIDSYQHYVDTLGVIYETQLSAKDSIIANRGKLYSDLRTSFDKVSGNYLALYNDYGKEVKKRKKSRTLNRVLAAGVIVVGGFFLLK